MVSGVALGVSENSAWIVVGALFSNVVAALEERVYRSTVAVGRGKGV